MNSEDQTVMNAEGNLDFKHGTLVVHRGHLALHFSTKTHSGTRVFTPVHASCGLLKESAVGCRPASGAPLQGIRIILTGSVRV